MKKLAKLVALAASLTALIFSGCSNLVDDASIEGDTIKAGGSKRLTLYATGSTENLVFPEDSGRMILPAALDGNDLKFVLFAQDQLDNTKQYCKKVTFVATAGSNGRTGTVDIDLTTSKYTLYLYALTEDVNITGTYASDETTVTGSTKTVMKATATVDMRYNEKVSFYLTPYSLGGSGGINLTFKTDWDLDTIYQVDNKIAFLIENINTAASIKNTSLVADSDIAANKLNKNWTEASVDSGTYNLKVKFIDSNTGKTYVWSDTIVILQNQITTATIYVPNVIGLKPKKPAGFTAKYAEPENEDSGFYDVEFLWSAPDTDNEQYFQIELMNPDTSNTPANYSYANLYTMNAANTAFDQTTADDNWKTLKTNGGKITTYEKLVYSESNYQAGSLNTNAESVVVSLPLGVRYIARIAAVNDAGTSDYVYVNLKLTDTGTTAWTDFVAPVTYKRREVGANITPKQFDSDDNGAYAVAVNLFRVKYDLANGAYYQTTYSAQTAGGTSVSDPAAGEIKSIATAAATADQGQIPTLNGSLTADIRYYTQLYDSASATPGTNKTGVALNNPLKENADFTDPAAPTGYSLYKTGASWTGWKLDSTSGSTIYTLNSRADRDTALPDQPLIGTSNATVGTHIVAASDYSANPAVPGDGSYPGYKNLSLYAVYGAGDVTVFNPADYAILDCDAVLLKGTASGIGSAVQIASLDNSKTFTINNNTTAGYKFLYIAIRELNYESVRVKVTSQSYGSLYDKKIDVIPTVHVNGTPTTSTTLTGNKRYVLTTSQPGDWVAGYAGYAKYADGKYTALAATETWTAGTFYKIVDDTKFTYFEIPLTSTFGAGTYTITLMGYNKNNPKVPYTYPVTMTVKESSTAIYSPTTFEPYNWTGNEDKYFTTTDGTTFTAATAGDWAKGEATGGIWQKD